MSNIYQKILSYSAIALGTILASTSLRVNAQTPVTKDSSNLENIMVEDDFDWTFSSEKESATVRDDIKELEQEKYSITEDDSELDLELSEEENKWGNQGDVENTSFEIEVYDY